MGPDFLAIQYDNTINAYLADEFNKINDCIVEKF